MSRWHPRRWRLSTRIVALFLLLLLLVQLASFTAIGIGIDRNARAAIRDDLAVGTRALQRLLAQNSAHLQDGATLLAADYGFREAVASDDRETMEDALANHGGRIGASVTALLGTRFALRASTERHVNPDLDRVIAVLAEGARGGAPQSTIDLMGGQPTQFVLVPMKAPQLVGWVLMGFRLDQSLADDVRRVTGLHLVVLARPGPQQVWTPAFGTLDAGVMREMTAAIGSAMAGSALNAGHEYGAHALPLVQGARGEAIALLLRSVDEAVAPYRRLQWVLGLLTLVGAVVFALGSVLAARRVTTPLRQLGRAVERLGRGDYATPMRGAWREDEIGELAQAFERMRISIATKQDEISRLAFQDPLTGLPNRARFRAAVHEAITRADAAPLAVLMLNLDRFKPINDRLGARAGDRLLQAVAQRLRSQALREGDVVARTGGDEFGVLLQGVDASQALAVAQRIAQSFEQPLTQDDQTVDIGAGIGIACWPSHAADAETLIGRAEIGMLAAKRRTSGPQPYDPADDVASAQTLSLLSELRHAIEHGELRMYLQPKIALTDGRVIGAEALVRWQHPKRGMMPPGMFIPFAEQTGFVRQLTLWIFEQAARQWTVFAASAGGALQVSVNLSTRDLLDQDLPDKLDAVLLRHGAPARGFCLEITESAIMDDPQRADATLQRLAARGFKLSIDDFGTGYSSLERLKKLPVDELKIDKSFVMGMEQDADDAKIVSLTIDLAHNLGLTVVAEGVENAAIWNHLHALGCDEAQGFHMTKPLPVDQFLAWRDRWNDRAASGWAGLALQ